MYLSLITKININLSKEKKRSELKDLEFLAEKSKDLLDRQITSYRQKHTNSGTVITVLALFIPLFLNGLDNSHIVVKLLGLVPIFLLIWAIISFIRVLRTKPLDQGFHIKKFNELVNSKYEDILLYEIGANTSSFKDNEKITEESNDKYNFAVKLTLLSIIFSTIILFTNNFTKPYNKLTEVENLNSNIMSKKKEKPREKPREIPTVPPSDRTNLNEELLNPKADKKK